MCGRFYLDVSKAELEEHYDLNDVPEMAAHFNIAPSTDIAAIREGEQGRELTMLRWGLVPAWSKEEKTQYSMINARAESVASKPAYRNAFIKRRCLIPASGFYEWQPQEKYKQPFVIQMKDESLFSLAGIWEHWEGKNGKTVESCSIIVTEANKVLVPIHDRMPVIINKDDYGSWLDPELQDKDALQEYLQPYNDKLMTAYPVSRKMNNPDFDSPECIQEKTA